MKQEEENQSKSPGTEQEKEQLMSRQKAIRKAGYIALSAATMMLLLSKPDKTMAAS